MALIGFYSEEELAELLDRRKITQLDYVTHQTPELLQEFEDFCLDRSLDADEDSAQLFLEERQRIFDDAFHDTDITLTM